MEVLTIHEILLDGLFVFIAVIIGMVGYAIYQHLLWKRIKTEHDIELSNKEIPPTPEPQPMIEDMVNSTKSLMDFIRELVELEILKIINTKSLLTQPYELVNLDKDIEKISTIVYQSLVPYVYNDTRTVLTAKAIQQYIIDESTILLLQYAKEYNASLRQL